MVNIYLAYKCAEGKEEVRNQIAEGKRKISVGRGERRSQKSDSRREKEDISRQRSERRKNQKL